MIEKTKLLIGAHTSGAGGLQNALYEGAEIGATTIQLFTANQKRWDGKGLTDEVVEAWFKARKETGIQVVMSHDSYLINLGAPDPENLIKSRKAFRAELERCHALKVDYLNFHPGASLTSPREESIERIIESLLELQDFAAEGQTKLLLEATAGQGSSIGYRFEELAAIIQGVNGKVPLGVCIDTCHIFAAGYDIRSASAFDLTLKTFDQVVGLKYLSAFHLNDSLKGLGSRVDRHASLGKGEIGLEAFRFIVTDPRTRRLPMYLETPEGPSRWKEEIATLKNMSKE